MIYGCGLCTHSYNGDIVTNCSATNSVVPDPQTLMRFADEAFEEICEEGRKKEEGAAKAGGGGA